MSRTMPARRELQFQDLSDVLREVDHLAAHGYQAAGKWNLAQMCDHLAYFMECSLDGFPARIPWIIRWAIGQPMLKRILNSGKMSAGSPTPQRPLPDRNQDEGAAIRRLKQAINRLLQPLTTLHDSPFFGPMTPDEWRRLHTIHAAHHLSFLVPKSGDAVTTASDLS